MGVIDKTTHKLTCDECGISEQVTMLDKGSAWGGSAWQEGKSFENFDVAWKTIVGGEPRVDKAKCKRCGAAPKMEIL